MLEKDTNFKPYEKNEVLLYEAMLFEENNQYEELIKFLNNN